MRSKKSLVSIITLIIFIGILFTFWYLQPKTPIKALEKHTANENIIRFSNLIKQIDVSPNECLIFYYNGNNNLACAVAKKVLFYYKIIYISSEIACENNSLRIGMLGSGFKDGKTFKSLIWGIIYDKSVNKIVNNNIEATKFVTSKFKMFYSINEGPLEFDYHIYNSNGYELEMLVN